jgi:hypothetical protein
MYSLEGIVNDQSQNIRVIKSMIMRQAGNAVGMREMKNCIKVLAGKHEGKRHKCRLKNNIKMDLKIYIGPRM